MSTVTSFIKTIKQPYGGYLPVKEFEVTALGGDMIDTVDENIAPQQVGVVVDYLTRFVTGSTAFEAFSTALNGAVLYFLYSRYWFDSLELEKISESEVFMGAFNATGVWDLISGMSELNADTIASACKLVEFDAIYRVGLGYLLSGNDIDIDEVKPNTKTISNIETMVLRAKSFFSKNGHVIRSGFDFEGAYTSHVTSGDGDFLTKDTLWDCKVFKSEPRSSHTLQLLVYYILGQHTGRPEFKSIKRLGIYNPRKDKSYTLEVSKISDTTIKTIEKCIGYRV